MCRPLPAGIPGLVETTNAATPLAGIRSIVTFPHGHRRGRDTSLRMGPRCSGSRMTKSPNHEGPRVIATLPCWATSARKPASKGDAAIERASIDQRLHEVCDARALGVLAVDPDLLSLIGDVSNRDSHWAIGRLA